MEKKPQTRVLLRPALHKCNHCGKKTAYLKAEWSDVVEICKSCGYRVYL